MYDIIIIGGGPAGLTAAIYGRRAGKSVLVIEKDTFGGQITSSPKVENIPGFTEITGSEFGEKLVEQAMAQDAEVECAEVLRIEDGEVKRVVTDYGEFEGRTVIIATGTKHRLLGLDGEEELVGEGISFCAVCDGAFCEGQTVAVVGGGNSALQEALMLSELAAKVYVIQNLDHFTGEPKLAEKLTSKENVEIRLGTVLTAYVGDGTIEGIRVRSDDGSEDEIKVDGVFLAVGLIPQNGAFDGTVELDGRGYIVAGEDCKTSTSGIFAAGDCRTKFIRQVTTATADGTNAALAACDYVDGLNI